MASTKDDLDEEFVIRCYKPSGRQINSALKKAVHMMKQHDYNLVWMTDEECNAVQVRDKKCVFIFDEFGGDTFEHIKGTGNRIFGPMCIMHSLKLKQPIPHSTTPVYTAAMRDLLVCCTAIERTKREELHALVQQMGGHVSGALSEEVTHLVVGEVGSKKYLVACHSGKKVMSPEWVQAVWEQSQNNLVLATDDQFTKYRCPVFKGMVVTVSGISPDTRQEVKRLVEQEGGRYSGEMKINECTHLIIDEPKGQKYEFAKKWRIKIVSTKWLYTSLEKGFCQDDRFFKPESSGQSSLKTSTPTKDGTRESIAGISDVSAISMTHVNETGIGAHNMTAAMDTKDPLQQLDVTTVSAHGFLDGCMIYTSGFQGPAMEKIKKLINKAGATRFNELHESVSHIILASKSEDIVAQVQELGIRPHIVKLDWLLQCGQQGRAVSEDSYLWTDLPELTTAPEVVKAKPKASDRSRKAPLDKAEENEDADVTIQCPPGGAAEDDMQQLMSQYIQNEESTTNESALLRAAEQVSQQQQEPPPPPPEGTPVQEDEDEDATQDPNSEQPGGLFSGKSFVLIGFDVEEQEQMAGFIRESAGEVVPQQTRKIPDYAVVPVFGAEVKMTVGEVVTNVWLQMCLCEERVLDVSDNELHAPLPNVPGAEPLEGCVLSISGYSGTERDALMHVAELLGANCQEFFVRKAGKGRMASTHLVVNAPEGSKYQAALKWKLPAITKYWLYESAKLGKKAPEAEFSADNPDAHKPKTAADSTLSSSSAAPRPSLSNTSITSAGSINSIATSKQDVSTGRDISADHKGTSSNEHDETTLPDLETNEREEIANQRQVNKKVADSVTMETDVDNHKSLPPAQKSNKQEEDDAIETAAAGNVKSAAVKRITENDARAASPAFTAGGRLNRLSTSRKGSIVSDADDTSDGLNREGKENKVREEETNDHTSSLKHINSKPLKENKVIKEGSIDHTASHKHKNEKPLNSRVKDLKEDGRPISPKQSPGRRDSMGVATPGKFLNPDKKFMPKFDMTDFLAMLATPEGQARQKQENPETPLEVLFTRNLAQAVKNTANPSFFLSSQPQHDESMAEPEASLGPLHGVILCVAKKLSSRQGEFNKMAASLGADYRWTYDQSCTHFIFQGRPNDLTKEFRVARDQGKFVVSPHWLQMCVEQNARVDESLFPHNFNPNMTLSMMSQKGRTPARAKATPRRSARSRKQQEEEDAASKPSNTTPPSDQETDNAMDGFTKTSDTAEQTDCSTGAQATQSLEVKEALTKQLGHIMAATRAIKSGKRRSRRLNTSEGTGSDSDASHSRSSSRQRSRLDDDLDGSPVLKRSSPLTSKPCLNQPAAPELHTEASQSVQVTWDDPTDRLEQEQLAHELNQNSESSQPEEPRCVMDQVTIKEAPMENDETINPEETNRQPEPEAPSIALPLLKQKTLVEEPQPVELEHDEGEAEPAPVNQPPVFLLSGMNQPEKDDYGALIEQLGGVLVDHGFYDNRCTHLVVGNPTRNEKFLACVATGKWILHKSYFESCRRQTKFVEEEAHEWGGASTLGILSKMSSQAQRLAQAAHKWRCKLQLGPKRETKGAFTSWKVIILTSEKREDGFRRLLEAGGAVVVATRPPFTNLDQVTHAFMDLNKVKEKVNLRDFLDAGVHCLKPEYIAAFLTDDPAPEMTAFEIPEIQSLLQSAGAISSKRKSSECHGSTGKRSRLR